MSPSILKTTYSFTTPSNPTNAPPPHPSPLLAELPPPLPTLPTPVPTDHLSDKAEVKSIAEPTGLYGPLLSAMAEVREKVNDELTSWKEWEDKEFGGVGLGGSKKKDTAGKKLLLNISVPSSGSKKELRPPRRRLPSFTSGARPGIEVVLL
ncbi:hypothetical protein BDY24DRAFT_416340 [Mrakia frigida]|uniref:uncharacterized protein n=1 Tax=Mrakia frigida TaxID=29902 RepID=UPI003FCC1841